MANHVFAVVAGFGRTLVPNTPCRLIQSPGPPPTVIASHYHPRGLKRATLSFPEVGNPRWDLGPGTASLAEVLDLIEGPAQVYWTIETTLYSVRWPADFTFYSSGARQPPVFELHGPENTLLWIQGPLSIDKLPEPHNLVAPGQTLQREGELSGTRWVELAYTHEGVAWRQRHYLAVSWPDAFVLLTAQYREPQAELAELAAEEMVATLVPATGETGPRSRGR
jgi:hypothetical protein